MLAKAYKVRTDEIGEIKKGGKLYQSESFGFLILRRGDKVGSRFAVVVSTKVAKHSSKRSKVKRVLSEAIRQSITQLKPGYSGLFLAKPISVRKYTDELMNEVRLMFHKASLYK